MPHSYPVSGKIRLYIHSLFLKACFMGLNVFSIHQPNDVLAKPWVQM
ncbi:BnaCnng08090D [Brassica napus]|uniref:(rape) hypothetical protein n=1 Tax=Brassica napus TaxID=3708 RepID=A0A078HFT2_BRANA|nr:unnamed protein product [Brassica napus]CDY37255.1 BnaCnng08090D [Brassica napus]